MKGFRKSTAAIGIALLALLVLPGQVQAADPAGGQAAGPAKMEAKSPCMCDCCCGGCECDCGKGRECGHKHGVHGMHPIMEGMKTHMEEVRKIVAALRDNEKKMGGLTDPAEFRKAAIAHFRMLDDLQESHVRHMDSMMGGAGRGHGHHGHGHHEQCEDCPRR